MILFIAICVALLVIDAFTKPRCSCDHASKPSGLSKEEDFDGFA